MQPKNVREAQAETIDRSLNCFHHRRSAIGMSKAGRNRQSIGDGNSFGRSDDNRTSTYWKYNNRRPSAWVNCNLRPTIRVLIQVPLATRIPDRIPTPEPPQPLAINPVPVLINPGLFIQPSTCISILVIVDRARASIGPSGVGGGDDAVGAVDVLLNGVAGRVEECGDVEVGVAQVVRTRVTRKGYRCRCFRRARWRRRCNAVTRRTGTLAVAIRSLLPHDKAAVGRS